MPVKHNLVSKESTVVVTTDITDILDDDKLTDAEKRKRALYRSIQELLSAYHALMQTDAEIDAEAAARKAVIDTETAQKKLARPTGTFATADTKKAVGTEKGAL